MQQLFRFLEEAAWFLRFELIFVAVTAVCLLLPQLALYLYRWQQGHPQPKQVQKPRPRQRPEVRAAPEALLDGKPDGSLAAKLQQMGTAPSPRSPGFTSPSPRRRPGAGGAGGGGGGAEHQGRAMARQAARMILAESCRDRGRPLEMHQDALSAGTSFAWLSEQEANRLYLALGLASLRADHADAAATLLRDMRRHRIPVPPALLSLIVKRRTARRLFKKSLAAYDVVTANEAGRQPKVEDPEFWGSLLLSSVETGEYGRCDAFWDALKLAGAPTAQDFGCMIRARCARSDWEELLRLVKAMHAEALPLDPAVCNPAISVCVASQQLQAGMEILEAVEQDGRAGKDVAAYNVLMKGFAFAEDLDGALRLQARMQARGVEPTQVTFGILLDACVSKGDLESAAAVFQEILSTGLPMNTVLYTTLIKGLARAGHVDKAMEVYKHMSENSGLKPDTIMFSVLIKANSDAGRMEGALRLFESMVEQGSAVDEIVFNNLLVGCARDSNLKLAKKLLEDMRKFGVQPSHATASILIKLYAKCQLLDEAQQLLVSMPQEFGLEPEPRHFMQLVHASIRDRQGRRAVEVYRMSMRVSQPDPATIGNLIGACLNLNMLETAMELHATAVRAGCTVLPKDTQAVQQALDRKALQQRAVGSQSAWQKRRCFCGP